MLALQAITPKELAAQVTGVTLAEARKLVARVHRGQPVAACSAVRRSAAEAVRAAGEIPQLDIVAETRSRIDPFVKYLLAAPDGARFEAVRIPLERDGRFSVCVSSQVGCGLGCTFCATGRLGLARNLAAWEIVEQVRVVRARLVPEIRGGPRSAVPDAPARPDARADRRTRTGATPARVHGVVFQGMGEPMANLDAVLGAIHVLTDPCALGIDALAITVCTSGLPAGIRRLAAEAPRVRLGISIGSALSERRSALMPITRAHSLDDVLAAAGDHVRETGLSPMWAVTLLDGVNDGDDDARGLVARARAFEAATGKRPRLSIVAYNAIGREDPFQRSPREAEFRAVLSGAGLASHRRYSGGSDVGAACGQLAGRLGTG
jgi:23S rRNA (adenine2503-C2)-methyltransferase